MRQFDGKNHLNNRFRERDEQLGTPGSILDANWLNSVQDELTNTIEAMGITLNPNDPTQLKQAMQIISAVPDSSSIDKIGRDNRNKYAGNGFTEWGFHLDATGVLPINNGASTWDTTIIAAGNETQAKTIRNQIALSLSYSSDPGYVTDYSNTTYPIINVNGNLVHVCDVLDQRRSDYFNTPWNNTIALPPAPSGKEVIDYAAGLYMKFNTVAEAREYVLVDTANRELIMNRQDFIGIEVWFEEILEKDFVYPLGNVQYSRKSYNNTVNRTINVETPINLVNNVVPQSYSALGEWDTVTKGYGIKWSTLSTADKLRFISDSRNNIFFDNKNLKLIQIRYRIRSVAGNTNGDLYTFSRMKAMDTSNSLYSYNIGEKGSVVNPETGGKYSVNSLQPRGSTIPALDFNDAYALSNPGYFTSSNARNDSIRQITNSKPGIFISTSYRDEQGAVITNSNNRIGHVASSYNNQCFVVPMFFVSRLNQGAFHPVYNPMGTDLFGLNDGTGAKWDVAQGALSNQLVRAPTSQWDCFMTVADGGSRCNTQAGLLITATSGHPLGYVSDKIYDWMVNDVRMNANKLDLNKAVNNALTKIINFDTASTNLNRGRDFIPVMRKKTGISGGSSIFALYVRNIPGFDATGVKKTLAPGDFLLIRITSFGDTNMATVVPGISLNTWYTVKVLGNGYTGDNPFLSLPLELIGTKLHYIKESANISVVRAETQYISAGNTNTVVFDAIYPDELGLTVSGKNNTPWFDIYGTPSQYVATFPNGGLGKFLPTNKPSGVFGSTMITSAAFIPGTDRYSGCCIQGNIALIGSSTGKISRSTDGGKTWSAAIANSFAGGQISHFSMSKTNSIAIAVSYNGKVCRSTDAGATWGAALTNTFGGAYILGSCISDDGTKAYICGAGGRVDKSVDSGTTWSNAKVLPDTNIKLRGICCSSDGVKVYAVGDNGNILRSTDSGATWTTITNVNSVNNVNLDGVICSADGTIVYAINDFGQIIKSVDSGVTWSNNIYTSIAASNALMNNSTGGNRISVDSTGQYVIASSYMFICRSHDGGATWSHKLSLPYVGSNLDVVVSMSLNSDLSKILIACPNTGILQSDNPFGANDPGTNATYSRPNISANDLPVSQIRVTSNNGVTWSDSPVPFSKTHESNQMNLNSFGTDAMLYFVPYVCKPYCTAGFLNQATTKVKQVNASNSAFYLNNFAQSNYIKSAIGRVSLNSEPGSKLRQMIGTQQFLINDDVLNRNVTHETQFKNIVPSNVYTQFKSSGILKFVPFVVETAGVLNLVMYYQDVHADYNSPTIVDDGSFKQILDSSVAQYAKTQDVGGNYVFAGQEILCQPLGFATKGDF